MALISCPECGKEISDKASQCIHCGCPISQPKTPLDNNVFIEYNGKTRNCPTCGKPIAKNAMFCPNCGRSKPHLAKEIQIMLVILGVVIALILTIVLFTR